MQNRITRALGILVLATACSSPPRPATSDPGLATAPPATGEPAPAVDACTADAARLQPALDANLALFAKWGFPPEAVEKLELASASTELEAIPQGLPVVTLTPTQLELLRQAGTPSTIRTRLKSLGANEIVLAIESKTLWPAVVRLFHELPTGMRVHIAFSIDSSALRIGEPAAVEQLRAGGAAAFRDLGRDMAQRCPAVGELFMARSEEIAAVFARDAGSALRGCKCAVTASELANVYEALVVRSYVAGRSVKVSREGTTVGGWRSTPFADVARAFAALPADTEVSVAVDR